MVFLNGDFGIHPQLPLLHLVPQVQAGIRRQAGHFIIVQRHHHVRRQRFRRQTPLDGKRRIPVHLRIQVQPGSAARPSIQIAHRARQLIQANTEIGAQRQVFMAYLTADQTHAIHRHLPGF